VKIWKKNNNEFGKDSSEITSIDKKLSCWCDSRSYCLRRAV